MHFADIMADRAASSRVSVGVCEARHSEISGRGVPTATAIRSVGYVAPVISPSLRPEDNPNSLEEVPSRPGNLRRTAVELAERIEQLLDGAERRAEEVELEAKRSAQLYLAQRRDEADEELNRRVEDATRELEAPARALLEVSTSLRAQLERALTDLNAAERSATEALDRFREAGPAATPPPSEADGPGGKDAAVLRAAQLAVAGLAREDIARTLMTEYGSEDVEGIVDEILGR